MFEMKKKVIIGAGIFAVVIVVVLLCMFFFDYSIVFSVEDGSTQQIEYASGKKPEEVTAVRKGHLFHRKGQKLKVTVEGTVDYDKLGDYELTYTASSNGSKKSIKRIIQVVDTTAPEIILNGASEVNLEVGQEYVEDGCVANDIYDGDVSDQVSIEGSVDNSKVGDNTITYKVKDSSGNEAVAERVVHVVDTVPPVITLNGNATEYVQVGGTFTDAGFTAVDACDGDISATVEKDGSVDTGTVGVYEINYTATDSSGNSATVTRTVRVYKPMEVNTVDPGNKVVYLTFDDGPGPYTAQLLDILDKYNVKATFFVTNCKPAYQDMIAQEAARGHTVAIHSYSHDYAKIYAGQDAFFQDMDAMNNIIQAQTGQSAWLLRFPGGSSNTVSKKYCSGIMSALANEVGARGFQYCDWNVSSGDAGETTSTAQVVANVTNGISKHNVSIVLQHDIKSFSVNAVEEIIQWGLSEGYTFLPLTSTSPMSHHGINN